LLGFALYPITRTPAVRRRTVDPIWKLNLGEPTAAPATTT